MAFIPTPHCALAVMEYALAGNTWTNTLWFLKSAFDVSDMEDLAGDLLIWNNGHVISYQVNGTTYEGCLVYDMSIENGAVVEGEESVLGGLRDGDPAAITACGVITFRTPGRGRSSRGRNYLSGLSETDVGEDSIEAVAVQDLIVEAYDELSSHIIGHGWAHVVVSLQHNGAPREVGEPQLVTSYELRSPLFGSQRRRIDRP